MLGATDFRFIQHVASYNLSYATVQEFEARKAVFVELDAELETINADPANTFTVGHNKFSTWTAAEKKKMLGYRHFMPEEPIWENGVTNADSVNWVKAGAVTGVKDQGQCGSCWAFSSTGSMEGCEQISTGTLTSQSEQELVDCAKGLNAGCNGGSMAYTFLWLKSNKTEAESSYTYTAKDGTCMMTSYKELYNSTAVNMITTESSKALMSSIATGPTSVAIEADKSVFQNYTSGILNSPLCGTTLDHGVLAVGYGTDAGQAYYLVKNSWGTGWGDAGYLKIANDGDGPGICGIQLGAVRPSC